MTILIKIDDKNIINLDAISNIKFNKSNITIVKNINKFIEFLEYREQYSYGGVVSSEENLLNKVLESDDLPPISLFIEYLNESERDMFIDTVPIYFMDIYLNNSTFYTLSYIKYNNELLREDGLGRHTSTKYIGKDEIEEQTKSFNDIKKIILDNVVNVK